MKILRLIASLDRRSGGPAAGILSISGPLADLGVQTDCLVMDESWKDANPSCMRSLGCGRAMTSYRYCPSLRPWLRQHLCEYDAVLVHGLWQYQGLAVRSELRQSQVPYFVMPHGMMDPHLASLSPLTHLKKKVYWRLAEHKVLGDAAAVLFTCDEERLLARVAYPESNYTERVVSYGSASAPEHLAELSRNFRKGLPRLGEAPYLLFMGRIHPKKGIELLCRAYTKQARLEASMPHLVIAGPCEDPSYQKRIQSETSQSPASGRIHWTGMLDGAHKWGALAGASALVLPSHQENFGIVVSEALSCGTPALLSTKVNIWKEVVHDGAGLAEPYTQAGIESLINQWLAMPANGWESMRANSLKCFSNRFDIKIVAQSLIQTITPFIHKQST